MAQEANENKIQKKLLKLQKRLKRNPNKMT